MTTTEQPTSVRRPAFQARNHLYIDGSWVAAEGDLVTTVIDSSTEQPVGEVKAATIAQLHAAIAAAKQAAPSWRSLSPADRATFLSRLHAELSARADDLTSLTAAEVGTPVRLGRSVQVELPLRVLAFYIDLLKTYEFEAAVGNSLVVKDPIGVVGTIAPWNYPLHQTMAKIAPALAAGATVVHKPSGLAPLTAFALADAIDAAAFPSGVFNLVAGGGAEIGEAMATDPGIDMISFTGSTNTGLRVAQLAARSLKRVALELGGKSANVILEDADLARAVSAGVNNAFLNSGQTCNAWTRMLVPRSRVSEVADLARAAVARLRIGDPFDESTRLGPLVSDHQLRRVKEYIKVGVAEGARLLTGGTVAPDGFETGFYCQPTIFVDVTPQMVIAREEIFGPVLAIMAYADESHALDLANATEFGLAGAVWSADDARASRFARGMRTGQVDINGGRFNIAAPFGGVGKSGIGRELGREGLEEFLELKALQFPLLLDAE